MIKVRRRRKENMRPRVRSWINGKRKLRGSDLTVSLQANLSIGSRLGKIPFLSAKAPPSFEADWPRFLSYLRQEFSHIFYFCCFKTLRPVTKHSWVRPGNFCLENGHRPPLFTCPVKCEKRCSHCKSYRAEYKGLTRCRDAFQQ